MNGGDETRLEQRFSSDSEICTTFCWRKLIVKLPSSASRKPKFFATENSAAEDNRRTYLFYSPIHRVPFSAFAMQMRELWKKERNIEIAMMFDRSVTVRLIWSVLKLAVTIAIRTELLDGRMKNEWKRIDRHSLDEFFNRSCFSDIRRSDSFFLYDTLTAMHALVPRHVQANRINAHFLCSTLAFRCCRGCDSRLTSWRNSVHSFGTQTVMQPSFEVQEGGREFVGQ